MRYLLVCIGIALAVYALTRLARSIAGWIYEIVEQDEPGSISRSLTPVDARHNSWVAKRYRRWRLRLRAGFGPSRGGKPRRPGARRNGANGRPGHRPNRI